MGSNEVDGDGGLSSVEESRVDCVELAREVVSSGGRVGGREVGTGSGIARKTKAKRGASSRASKVWKKK